MIGPFRRKRKPPDVRTAVMPAPIDPALELAQQRLAEKCRGIEERIERVLERLRSQLPPEEEAR